MEKNTQLFRSEYFVRLNEKRFQHLDTLGLLKKGLRILEVGAGVGDHTKFLLSRGCDVTSTDARPENLEILKKDLPSVKTALLNLDSPSCPFESEFDLVHCYGTLYHLENPEAGIKFMSDWGDSLVLETCVLYSNNIDILMFQEDPEDPTRSFSGWACRPTRQWVFSKLKKYYPFVYSTINQPDHEEFPVDWAKERQCAVAGSGEMETDNFSTYRAVFVASKKLLENTNLIQHLPDYQVSVRNAYATFLT